MRNRNAVKESVYPFLLFLFSPVLMLILSFKENQSKWAINIFWLFIAYFTSNISRIDNSWDISRYISLFELTYKSGQNFWNFIEELFNSSPDFLQPLINFIVSRFTGNFRILLFFYGIVYGYFYSRNVFYLLEVFSGKLNRITGLIVIAVCFVVGIMEFNGFRYFTASQMFVYGLIRYYIKQDKKGWIFIVASLLMHYSFVLAVAATLTYEFIIRNKLWLAMLLFVASNFASNLGLEKLIPKEILPQAYQTKMNSYVGKERIEAVQQSTNYELNGYVNWPVTFVGNFCLFGIIYMYFRIAWQKKYVPRREYFIMALVFGTVSNIAASNSASGARFLMVFYVIMGFYFMTVYNELILDRLFEMYSNYYSWFFILSIIVSIRRLFDYLGFSTLLGGPLVRAFFDEDTPIIDGFKAFFPSF